MAFLGDMDQREATAAVQLPESNRVDPIVLRLLTGACRDQGWCDEIAVVAPGGQLTLEYEAGTARVVAGAQ